MTNEESDGLRDRIADAIRRYDWDHGISSNPDVGEHQRGEAEAVMAVIDPELDALWDQIHRDQHDAMDQAQRADQAEAALAEARRIHLAAAAHDTIGRGLACGMCAALGITHRPSVVPAPGLAKETPR